VREDEPPDKPFVPKAPAIRKSGYVRSVERTYREMERSSIARAEEAADQLEAAYASQPRDAEFSGLLQATQREQVAQLKSDLKITNMKDPGQMREGESAAIMPAMSADSPVVKGAAFQMMGGAPADVAPGVGGGGLPVRAVRDSLAGSHAANANRLIRAGNMGTYRDG
jgi:hypothetical protein